MILHNSRNKDTCFFCKTTSKRTRKLDLSQNEDDHLNEDDFKNGVELRNLDNPTSNL